MQLLAELWLPILVSAALVFVAGSLPASSPGSGDDDVEDVAG